MIQTPLSPTLELACQLIRCRSITPNDAGCQELMIPRLEALGFQVERLRFGDVDNFWARLGDRGPLLVFAGHTDVVPPGPEANWHHPPFEPQIENGMLHGRGAADMKGSLAAFVTACERFLAAHPQPRGSIGFLITSDEEGVAINGTVRVVEHLSARNERIDWCIIGEPSSTAQLGDVIKNGRRGSLSARLVVKGLQGHVAYPDLAANPIHLGAPALVDLTQEVWDQGNEFFPATTFQISNIRAGTGATNVIPGELEILCNFRFSPEVTVIELQQRTEAILLRHGLNYELEWHLSGQPFLTAQGELVDAVTASIQEVTGRVPELSTSGGTSDGRFIAPTGAQIVELGLVNATIHKVNEHVRVEDLDQLSEIYERVLVKLLG